GQDVDYSTGGAAGLIANGFAFEILQLVDPGFFHADDRQWRILEMDVHKDKFFSGVLRVKADHGSDVGPAEIVGAGCDVSGSVGRAGAAVEPHIEACGLG